MSTIDNALTTLTRAKNYLDITGTSKDTVLTMLIIAASNYVRTFCRRQFTRAVYTRELHNGDDSRDIVLKNYPVIQGQAVTFERRRTTSNENSWETIDSNDYFINYKSGVITLLYELDPGVQNYAVTYTAGFYLPKDTEYQDGTNDELDLPYDLETVILDLVGYILNSRKSSGYSSQSARDVSVVFQKAVNNDSVMREILTLYKKKI